MARLNMARSRVRFSICSFARIAQTWPGRNGGFGPGILPLFQAGRPGLGLDEGLLSFMVGLPVERPSTLRSGESNSLMERQLPDWICPGMVIRRGGPSRNETLSSPCVRGSIAVYHASTLCDDI